MQQAIAKQVLSLLDLTSLNDNDNDAVITKLCNNASTQHGHTAAICIYSRFIPHAKTILHKVNPEVKIATVTNFPHGSDDIDLAIYETSLAIKRGADEVDLVFPYHALMHGKDKVGAEMVKQTKATCGDKTLKVIIESGELKTDKLIQQASIIALENGADFIKTSTGKVAVNATLEASEIMLNAIKSSGKKAGFKAAGGIKTVAEATKYLELAAQIMGDTWATTQTFRFGASSLLNNVLAILDGKSNSNASNYGY